jgi:gluconate 5-dehydrogenase
VNNNLFDFTGKRVLVTGGSRGLGLEIAKAFLVAGANVVINGRNADALNKVQMALKDQQLKLQVVAADLVDDAEPLVLKSASSLVDWISSFTPLGYETAALRWT